MPIFGFSSVKDMFDGGGKGGSGAKFSTKSHSDYKKANPKDKTVKASEPSKFAQGLKSFGDKYNLTGPPTAGALAAQKAFMDNVGKSDGGSSGIASLKNASAASVSTPEQQAENMKRYQEYLEAQKRKPTPEMRQEALNIFESQQGAGQMPYYMAAAQEATSPAFQYAAQNYGTLGGSQRLAPRPMEMMSVAERRQINDMAQGMADQQAAANEYQKGMDMVMRGGGKGGGKGGGATMPQGQPMMPTNLPPNFASMLASRFGGFGGQ